jgi:hypothetical protein
MAINLRKGSKVFVPLGNRRIEGVVIKRFSVRKGESGVPMDKRTLVNVRASGQLFVKRPSELKRR